MSTDPFKQPGSFWRGNIHTHSTRSDGVLEPEEVVRRYKAEGYDFLAMTDHFVGLFDYPLTDISAFADERFTTILGAELHTGAMENGEIWHILAVGLPADFAPPDAPDFRPIAAPESGPALAQRARDAGAFVAIAHPDWSQMTLADAASIEAANAVEVYNHGCFNGCDRGYWFHIYERLLAAGRKLTLCATDDAHFFEPDHFGGWVIVKARENTAPALLSALKEGAYYASTGPEFHDVILGGRSRRGVHLSRQRGDPSGQEHPHCYAPWPFDDTHCAAVRQAGPLSMAEGHHCGCSRKTRLDEPDLARLTLGGLRGARQAPRLALSA